MEEQQNSEMEAVEAYIRSQFDNYVKEKGLDTLPAQQQQQLPQTDQQQQQLIRELITGFMN